MILYCNSSMPAQERVNTFYFLQHVCFRIQSSSTLSSLFILWAARMRGGMKSKKWKGGNETTWKLIIRKYFAYENTFVDQRVKLQEFVIAFDWLFVCDCLASNVSLSIWSPRKSVITQLYAVNHLIIDVVKHKLA